MNSNMLNDCQTYGLAVNKEVYHAEAIDRRR